MFLIDFTWELGRCMYVRYHIFNLRNYSCLVRCHCINYFSIHGDVKQADLNLVHIIYEYINEMYFENRSTALYTVHVVYKTFRVVFNCYRGNREYFSTTRIQKKWISNSLEESFLLIFPK